MEKLVRLCKSRGFIFPGSEIYDGLANTWDFGPLGVEIKNNIKREWWKYFVQESENSVGMDGGILMNPNVWVASGHVGGFSDPLMDCKQCKTRHRADHLIESKYPDAKADSMKQDQMQAFIGEKKIKCPHCGLFEWTDIRQFNLMFATQRGVVDDKLNTIYLRPETAQSQFVNFQNIQRTTRLKVPFGVGQIGKSFRNEVTPGNFVFRTIEFEQMEHQWFTTKKQAMKDYENYKKQAIDFYTSRLGIDARKLRLKDHEQLSHYAKAAADMEYNYSFGWGEVGGTHHRSEFDLTQHQKHSNKSMEYTDPVTGEKFIPTVIESCHGVERLLLAVLDDAYNEDEVDGETRVVLKIKPSIAPYKVAVLPLQKKEQGEKAMQVYRMLTKHFMATYDETASIGKRYRRQDEIGTPFCVTVDFDTLTDDTVTLRDRDTMQQKRVKIADLVQEIKCIIDPTR